MYTLPAHERVRFDSPNARVPRALLKGNPAAMDGALVSVIIRPPLTFPGPLDFPFSVIVVNGRWTSFSETPAKKLLVVILFFVMNQVHLYFSKAFLWGVGLSFPEGKGSYYLGKDAVLQQHISEETQ